MNENSSDVLYIDDMPEGWNASEYTDYETGGDEDTDDTDARAEHLPTGDALEPSTELFGSYCKYNPNSKNCYLYRACRHRSYCVISGYMIVPGWACAGMEEINGGNAGKFDYLMRAARDKCSDTHCVLITNPTCCRTQDQLHIHYRHYNGGGSALKAQLEGQLCHSHGGWQYFKKCGSGKARIYDYFPDVFSEVASAYDGESLGHVGITVMFTTECGGHKTILLATKDCSIEHSISAR